MISLKFIFFQVIFFAQKKNLFFSNKIIMWERCEKKNEILATGRSNAVTYTNSCCFLFSCVITNYHLDVRIELMCLCVCICMCVYIRRYVYVCMYVFMCMCMWMCLCVNVHVCMYMCISMCVANMMYSSVAVLCD